MFGAQTSLVCTWLLYIFLSIAPIIIISLKKKDKGDEKK